MLRSPRVLPSGDPCDFSRQATAQKTDSTAYKGEVATSFCGLAGQGGIQATLFEDEVENLDADFSIPADAEPRGDEKWWSWRWLQTGMRTSQMPMR